MTLLRFPLTRLHPPLSLRRQISVSATQRPPSRLALPARDRTIDFGKHKGRMLGSLPSKYLIWVSRNLRAGDFEEWARLADDVLVDPVYRDRVEWESAERLLTGDDARHRSSDSPVADLLEVGDQFGWNTRDKAGWARVDFALLGTSRGGRIPRIGETKSSQSHPRREKVGSLKMGGRFSLEEEEVKGEREREGRREKRRMKRVEQMQEMRREVGVDGDLVNREGNIGGGQVIVNPFPGRGALLGKITFPGRGAPLDKIKMRDRA